METSKEVLKAGYINTSDCEMLFECLKNRNVLYHTHQKNPAIEAENLILEHYFPVLARVYSTLKEKAKSMTDGLKDAHRNPIINVIRANNRG
ncbi:MAG: hypothetical protein OXF60_07635 [Gammaproteobacteria bacterium]|nr:hypothetical protein [Gammaproteobacteria bacterium]